MTQAPTIGRIVQYRLSDGDVQAIIAKRLKDGTSGNTPGAGELYPATIVRVWNGSGVNLQVHLDGPDAYWATSRVEGESEGQWAWPARA